MNEEDVKTKKDFINDLKFGDKLNSENFSINSEDRIILKNSINKITSMLKEKQKSENLRWNQYFSLENIENIPKTRQLFQNAIIYEIVREELFERWKILPSSFYAKQLTNDFLLKNINHPLTKRIIFETIIRQGGDKIFILDKNVEYNLINTKNNILLDRKMPFEKIFLDTIIDMENKKYNQEYGLIKIIGISLTEYYKEQKRNINIRLVVDVEKLLYPRIFSFDLYKDKLTKKDIISNEFYIPDTKNLREFVSKFIDKDFIKKIREYICNFLDFLNHPNVEIKEKKWYNNEKRIQKGKIPIPDKVEIKITGNLKKYLYETNTKQKGKEHKNSFWVRGHYFHYRNREHWKGLYSLNEQKLQRKGYFTDKQGLISKWILPFIKGTGDIKNKSYKLE